MSEKMKALLANGRDYFTPCEVASVLGMNPQAVRILARENPERLGFPVVVSGSRVKIPRQPFLKFMGVADPALSGGVGA